MDLTTLPPEVLVTLLKYLTPADLVRLRKRSKFISQVGNYYRICKRVPIGVIHIFLTRKIRPLYFWINKSLENAYNLQPGPPPISGFSPQFLDRSSGGSTLERSKPYYFDSCRMPNVLQKVQVINECCFDGLFSKISRENMKLDHSVIKMLESNADALNLCKAIHFHCVKFACTKNEARTFINLFPKATKLHLRNTSNSSILMDLEILGGRTWSAITVECTDILYPQCNYLNDFLLDYIASNSTTLNISNYSTSFTLRGVLAALQIISLDTRYSGKSNWGIILFGDVEIEYVMDQISKIQGLKVNIDPSNRCYSTRVVTASRLVVTFQNSEKEICFWKKKTNIRRF